MPAYILLYHMNNCPHCISLRPIWDQVKKTASKTCNIAEIEYSRMADLPESMRAIRGFPTIMAYNDTTPVAEYNGDRSVRSIVDFARTYATKPKSPQQPQKQKKTKTPRTKKV